MSRPRKPYGSDLPGRLPATMLKVLAAEMSDQGRLSRGKRYWSDDAVIDIVVGHGAVTAEIQGSRSQPYVVTIEADPGRGVPSKRETWIRCTCPDDSGTGNEACKHAVAALFALSDEVAIEPDLLERWRGGSRAPRPTAAAPAPPPAAARPELPSNVVPIRRDRPVIEPDPEPIDDTIDEIARLLSAPGGAGAPDFPEASLIEHRSMRDRTIADVLNDALDHLMIRWD
jgi:uncharacterized Zn finger protein